MTFQTPNRHQIASGMVEIAETIACGVLPGDECCRGAHAQFRAYKSLAWVYRWDFRDGDNPGKFLRALAEFHEDPAIRGESILQLEARQLAVWIAPDAEGRLAKIIDEIRTKGAA
jgi:hypothetical protein